MYTGSLLGENSPVKATFAAFHTGTGQPFPASGLPEGRGWSWDALLDAGLDLHIFLDRPCFLDELTFTLSPDSGARAVELLDLGAERPFPVLARLTAGNASFLPGGEYRMAVGMEAQKLCLRFDTCLKNLCVTALGLTGSVWENPVLYPVPEKLVLSGSALNAAGFGAVQPADENDPDLAFAAEELRASLSSRTAALRGGSGVIRLVKDGAVRPEGYLLTAAQGEITLSAAGRAGLIYGAERLTQLLSAGEFPACRIEDGPRLAFRGFHLGLPPREEIPFFKRLIRTLLAPMGYNTLFLQITAGMQFDRHPELNEAWFAANERAKKGEWPKLHHGDMVADGSILTKDEVRDLAAYARSYGLEVIPEIQSLSHVQYLTLAHPELAETDPDAQKDTLLDTRLADQPPAAFYKHSVCPQNEDYYALIEDVIDEITEVIQPKEYVHMGHDEVYQIGICPRCRDKDPAWLLALHINRIHDYLAKKGYRMMIWADMLQPDSGYQTPAAISQIPNDITLLDFIWYFHPDKDLEDNLLPYGFPVIMGNLYSSHYPRYENRSRKAGITGGQVSSWCRPDEAVLGREGKLYDLLYTANMLWSADYRAGLRATWTKMICRLLPEIRSALHGVPAPSLASGAEIVPLPLNGEKGAPAAVEAALARAGSVSFRGKTLPAASPVLVRPGCPLSLDLAGGAKSLLVGMAAALPLRKEAWEPAPAIAELRVTFADGTRECRSICYGQETGLYSRPYGAPMPHPYYRHTGYQATWFSDPLFAGKSPDGGDVTLYGWEWYSESGKSIVSAEIAAAPEGGELIVACAAAVR